MIKYKTILTFALMMVMLPSCRPAEQSDDNSVSREEVEALYSDLRQCTLNYIDSMKNSPDTTNFRAMAERYEDKITAIYFKYPPDTDVKLSSVEQNNLWILSQNFVKIRDKRIGGNLSLPDSLASPQ